MTNITEKNSQLHTRTSFSFPGAFAHDKAETKFTPLLNDSVINQSLEVIKFLTDDVVMCMTNVDNIVHSLFGNTSTTPETASTNDVCPGGSLNIILSELTVLHRYVGSLKERISALEHRL